MRRFASILAILALIAFSGTLVGCSGGEADSGGEGESESSE